jgi:MASE9 protein
MNRTTRIYVALVVTVATVLAAISLSRINVHDPLRSGGFLLVSLLASIFKVRIPGLTGIYSVNFIVMLAAVTEISGAELVIIAMGCAVIQSYWRAARRPQPVQVAFNASNLVISVAGAYALFHAFSFWPDEWLFMPVALAAAGYYILNTGLTAVVLCLAEGKTLPQIWDHWTLYTLPYFLLGSTLSCAWTFCSRQVHWQGMLVVVPGLYLLFRLFRSFVSTQQALKGQRV